ncbi:MAG: DUF169 domain-containing protein [Clostridium sp.]
MDFSTFIDLLKLNNKVISVSRINDMNCSDEIKAGCTLSILNESFNGKTIVFTSEMKSCSGAIRGFGFKDGFPNVPGGFGMFLTTGAGKGCPPGERIKCSTDIAEEMLLSQPTDVMNGHTAILTKPYEDSDSADLVISLVNPDQLSALIHLFNYRKTDYDNVIMPMVSGCASVFRIPFDELKRDNPRAVVGNVDVFSRPHFEKDTFLFIVPHKDFKNMLSDADRSFLFAPIWNGVKKRL